MNEDNIDMNWQITGIYYYFSTYFYGSPPVLS